MTWSFGEDFHVTWRTADVSGRGGMSTVFIKSPWILFLGLACQRFSSLSWLTSSGSSVAELIPFLNVEQTFSSSVPPRYTDGMLKPK